MGADPGVVEGEMAPLRQLAQVVWRAHLLINSVTLVYADNSIILVYDDTSNVIVHVVILNPGTGSTAGSTVCPPASQQHHYRDTSLMRNTPLLGPWLGSAACPPEIVLLEFMTFSHQKDFDQ